MSNLFLAIILIVGLLLYLRLHRPHCPKCKSKMTFTDIGYMKDIITGRWVCFGCDYEEKISGVNPNPEWVAWRRGLNYLEKPAFFLGRGITVRKYFSTTTFEQARRKFAPWKA